MRRSWPWPAASWAAGKSEEFAEAFILALAAATDDEESRRRVKNVATTSGETFSPTGNRRAGGPELGELLTGDGVSVVRQVRDWLGLRATPGHRLGGTQARVRAVGVGPAVRPGHAAAVVPARDPARLAPGVRRGPGHGHPDPRVWRRHAVPGGGFRGIGGKITYQVRRGWYKAANVYVVVAMDPGERKSAVFKAVFAPVHAAEKAAMEAAGPVIAEAQAELGIMEARLKHLPDKGSEIGRPQ